MLDLDPIKQHLALCLRPTRHGQYWDARQIVEEDVPRLIAEVERYRDILAQLPGDLEGED